MDLSFFLTPPVAFLIFVAIVYASYILGSILTAKSRANVGGRDEVYACGEDVRPKTQAVNFLQFFLFALFFTIIDIVALVLGTVSHAPIVLVIAYLGAISLGLYVLMRKEKAGTKHE